MGSSQVTISSDEMVGDMVTVVDSAWTATLARRKRLDAGRHLHPDDGVCLMEYVSMLTGDGFTDTPRCTDPLIAELARMVNDSVGDRTRSALISLAPDLAGLPRTAPAAAPGVVGAVLDVALRRCPDRADLLRHRRRARRRARGGALRQAAAGGARPAVLEGLWQTFYRYGPARHAVACAVHAVSEHSESASARDRALTGMLEDAMSAARSLARA